MCVLAQDGLMRSRVYDTLECPSSCLSRRSTAGATCGEFAAEQGSCEPLLSRGSQLPICNVKWAGTSRYGEPADAISVPADGASEIVKFTTSIPRESCTNAKAKYSSSVVPPDPSVHFYHCC